MADSPYPGTSPEGSEDLRRAEKLRDKRRRGSARHRAKIQEAKAAIVAGAATPEQIAFYEKEIDRQKAASTKYNAELKRKVDSAVAAVATPYVPREQVAKRPRAPVGSLASLTPEEKRERAKETNRRACERRAARQLAVKLGLPPEPLLVRKATSDEERRLRKNASERQRRLDMTSEQREAYLLSERERSVEREAEMAAYRRKRYRENKEKIVAAVVDWQERNRDKVALYSARSSERAKARMAEDPEFREQQRVRRVTYERTRTDQDAGFRMLKALRSSLKQALRLYGEGRKTQSVKNLVGCSMAELIQHLEAQFEPWMNWTNHGRKGLDLERGGKAWVVDHIRPCASFDLTDPEQQAACFHYSNLQPLEYFTNIRKGDKLDWTPEGAEDVADAA